MGSILTVKTPAAAAARRLTTIERLTGDLILDADAAKTAFLARCIDTASSLMARHIKIRAGDDGRTTFARETLEETYRAPPCGIEGPAPLLLSRYPVHQIVKVTEDGVEYPRLLPGDIANPDFLYEVSKQAGFLWKCVDGTGERMRWSARRIIVEYEGGFITAGSATDEIVATVPPEIEDACVEFCKIKIRSLREDPEGIDQEQIVGLGMWNFNSISWQGGVPPSVAGALESYVREDI